MDLGTPKRPLSWSALSSWSYSKEQWYDRYILGKKDAPNAAMLFGKETGERLAADPLFLPQVPRYPVFEKELRGRIGDIFLIGFLDAYNPSNHAFYEYKTSAGKDKWTQKSADKHDQLLMYKLLLYQNHKILPEQISSVLISISARENGDFTLSVDENRPVKEFKVAHTVEQMLVFAASIKQTYKEMGEYTKARLSTVA